jgi:hypothetical protein
MTVKAESVLRSLFIVQLSFLQQACNSGHQVALAIIAVSEYFGFCSPTIFKPFVWKSFLTGLKRNGNTQHCKVCSLPIQCRLCVYCDIQNTNYFPNNWLIYIIETLYFRCGRNCICTCYLVALTAIYGPCHGSGGWVAALKLRRPGLDPRPKVALGYVFSPCQHHSIHAAYSFWSACCSYQKDKPTMPGNFPKAMLCWKSGNLPVTTLVSFKAIEDI